MQSLLRSKGVLRIGLLALTLAVALSSVATARPEPGAKARQGFRLFARPLGAMTVNRVYCGLSATGEVCVDSTNSSTIGGGFWPKGTADQYVFNSGLQLAGTIGSDGGPWAGDTTGAFFFDPKGTTQHGEQVTPIYNTQNPDDAAFIGAPGTSDPVALAARVPQGDANADVFDPLLQGRTAASQGDVWWLSWDGNPGLVAGRPHPLGVVVEQRGMGWNYPSGNEDIIYFIYTFYNITTTDPAAYAAVRPGMRDILIQQSQIFKQRNEATFGISLPSAGYTIENLYVGFGADMDVADAGVNYASVNVPFALGNTYDHSFSKFEGWTFDPAIFNQPGLFAGTGFVGVKYLKSPVVNGQEVGLTLFSNTTNGGGFSDARNTTQLFRYLSGAIDPAAGDDACSLDPVTTHICFIRNTSAFDMRFFQSSGPLTLAPGGFGSVVVAYIFAAPAAAGGTAACGVPDSPCDIKPGNPALIGGLDDPTVIGAGSGPGPFGGNVNLLDSVTGFRGARDLDANGVLTENEFDVVPNSLLDKANKAQAVFGISHFLLPFAPDPPQFFLIPGDQQVTVMWRPSPSETTGDPYFAVASQATVPCPDDATQTCPNNLYDPNYRQYDVEGYRVYRGRVDAPNSLQLLAQFDYAGTTISDYAGQVNPTNLCAPEAGVRIDCPANYDSVGAGLVRTVHNDVPLVGPIIQVKLGQRVKLADGTALLVVTDTALTGSAGGCKPSACPELSDTGVPFVYVDNTVRNNFRYFYSVTAFDVNSFQSGPANLESPRLTKPVTPVAPASNYQLSGQFTVAQLVGGDGTVLDPSLPLPTIDPTAGTFSGPFPPSNAWTIGFGDFVAAVLSQPGSFSATLDSIQLGSPYGGIAHRYYWSALGGTVHFSIPITQNEEVGVVSGAGQFAAVPVDASLAARYGGGAGYQLQGKVSMKLSGPDYGTLYGRGCVNNRPGFGTARECAYNGSRWFDGPSPQNNETKANPNEGNPPNFSGASMTTFNNAGALTGVVTIHNTIAYETVGGGEYRPVEGVKSGAHRATDFNVYWGSGGTVDSVTDVVYHTRVRFQSGAPDTVNGVPRQHGVSDGWGILNQSAAQPAAGSYDARTELTNTDMGCVEPFRSLGLSISCGGSGPQYVLSRTAVPGPIAMFDKSLSTAKTAAAAANAGFIMYLSGEWFTFELQGGAVPAAGTVWTLRAYEGAILHGGCATCGAGDYGPYEYSLPEGVLPLTAPGISLQGSYSVINQVNAPTDGDLSRVHTVPDPYYVTSPYEQTTDTKIIKFVNLPKDAIIRIYSSSGVLVQLLEHHSSTYGGEETWNVRNRNNQVVASGVYFYHIEAGNARRVGRFTIVNFAQ